MAISLLVGLVLRIRILSESSVPTRFPAVTAAAGLLGGLAFIALLAALLLPFARGERSGSAVRRIFGAIVLLHSALFFVWSEVLIYFGHPPRAVDLDVGLNVSFYADSLFTGTGAELLVLLAVVSALLVWAGRSARGARSSFVTFRNAVAAGAASSAVFFLPASLVSDTSGEPLVEMTRLGVERYRSPRESPVVIEPVRLSPAVRRLSPAGSRPLISADYPMAYRADDEGSPRLLPPGERPNVVFLILEGMQAEDLAVGGSPPGLTPNLDALAAAGYRFERAYSPGTHTEEGELAYWYGLLPVTNEWLMPDRPFARLTGLPEILRARGWRDFVWMYGGDQTFYARQRFYGMRGFRYFDAADFLPSDTRTSWGYSDLSLARRSIGVLRTAREPFAAMFVTISNHHPFKVPDDAKSTYDASPVESRCFGHYTKRMLETMHYADDAVGDFFRRARREPWFPHTIFVIGGDHGLPIEPVGVSRATSHQLEEFQHRIPLILYSPLLPGGKTFSGPTSQVDVLPTLLHLVAPDAVRTGAGVDLFGGERSERPIVLWSGQPRIVSVVTRDRTYHAVVRSSPAPPGAELQSESWVDPSRDPGGLHDLAGKEPQAFEGARGIARAFLEDYPLVVNSGHSGAPPDLIGATPRATQAAR